MIGKGVLTKIADEHGVDAPTVERDYALTHVVECLDAAGGDERLVFKGGTALRLVHFDDYRYSADLDFSLTDGLTTDEAFGTIATAAEIARERVGFDQLDLDGEGFLAYVGPLGRKRRIKLDLSDHELVTDSGRTSRELIRRYSDQIGGQVVVYTVDEIAAEKLRCVIQRVQARDLFDLHQLFVVRGIDVAEVWPEFEAKTKHKGIDHDIFFDRFDQRIPAWKKTWQDEMDEHVPEELHPHFNEIERTVRRALRAMKQ